MKSTDMFSSAETRSKENINISLASFEQPKGLATSPFVVSLWETKQVPEKPHVTSDEEALQSIEDLFRGKGRIPYPEKKSKFEEYSNTNQNEYSQPVTSPASFATPPKKIRIPSHQEQVKRLEEQKNEYSAIFKKPGTGSSGFFRNFAFWK